jgi:hypothetical protein
MLHQQVDIKLRVRLHFDNDQIDAWLLLANEFPQQLQLSSANSKSLTAELKDNSLVVGLFSTAVCETAHMGYPVVFLNQPGWFYTPDLAEFSGLSCSIAEFFNSCHNILNNPEVYENRRKLSIFSANRYYSDLAGLGFVADDIKRAQ